jgi:hypothetical protein
VFSIFYSLESYLAAISTEDINFASCIIKIKEEFCPYAQYPERLGHIVNTIVGFLSALRHVISNLCFYIFYDLRVT